MILSTFYAHIMEAATQEQVPIETILEKIGKAGITGIECDYDMFSSVPENERETFIKSFLEILTKYKLHVSSMYAHVDLTLKENVSIYNKALKVARALKSQYVLLIPGMIHRDVIASAEANRVQLVDMPEQIKIAHNMNTFVFDKAQEYGITITMEDFDDYHAPFASAKQLKWFTEQMPKLTIAFDTGNFVYAEDDVEEAYQLLKDRVGYVHLKDRQFKKKRGENPKITVKGREMYSAAVGSGDVPMESIIRQLAEGGYQGVLAIEHFGSCHQLADMLESAKYIKKMAEKYNFTIEK